MSKEVQVYEKKLNPLVERAIEIEIKNEKDLTEATVLLSKMNKIMDGIKAIKEKITKPALEIIAEERSRWKPAETAYKSAIDPLREKIGGYQTELVRKQDEEAAKIAARVGEGKGKLKVETAVKQIEALDVAPTKIETSSGGLKFRATQKLKVWDETLVPREYLLLNESKIMEDLKAGKKVEGCAIEVVQIPVNSR